MGPFAPPDAPSARLRGLSGQLAAAAGNASELARTQAAFWKSVAASGSPLIEAAADEERRVVTFLWRGDANTGSVRLEWPAWSFEFADPALVRLGASDVWWKSVELPAATRMSYRFVVDPPLDPKERFKLGDRLTIAASHSDRWNARRMREPPLDDAHAHSLLELPDAAPESWLTRTPPAQRGRLERHSIRSQRLGNEHALDVYLPAGYASAGPYPLLIAFDGESYTEQMDAPRLLDNLIAGGAIAPLVAVFVRNATPDSRSYELPCNPDFAEFLARELLPLVRTRYRISERPEQVALAGASFGGIAATFAALRHPELFGLVLSQSGSYWWTFWRGQPLFDGSAKPGWLERRFSERARLPLRFYLSAGSFERAQDDRGLLENFRRFRDALRAKGYPVRDREFAGGHDHVAWRADLPEGLIALFGAPQL
jgi:enterochelin esterase-like enzyme